MNICKVGNQTSSQDPQAVNSRIFVGNLNTFQVNKTDVEKVFQRYGRIAGISMHKGYAFVQFTSPFDARSGCLGEDGRLLCGQVIDVNMVSEPKPHQQGKVKGQKRPREASPHELSDPGRNLSATPEGQPLKLGESKPLDLNQLKAYNSPDVLICGNCKELFHHLTDIIEHKKHYCKLRFTCKCAPRHNPMDACSPQQSFGDDLSSTCDASLLCSSCQEGFPNPWDLMVHVQNVHHIEVFSFGDSELDTHIVPTGTNVLMQEQSLMH